MSEDAREMYRPPPSPELVTERQQLREELSLRKAVAHDHRVDVVCPVPGCPSVVQAPHGEEF